MANVEMEGVNMGEGVKMGPWHVATFSYEQDKLEMVHSGGLNMEVVMVGRDAQVATRSGGMAIQYKPEPTRPGSVDTLR